MTEGDPMKRRWDREHSFNIDPLVQGAAAVDFILGDIPVAKTQERGQPVEKQSLRM